MPQGVAYASLLFQAELPDSPTWFYFAALLLYVSALLTVALFFKFSRLLSVRNWDVLTLFLFMPGLLLLIESQGRSPWGYVGLLVAGGYFLARCLLDLTLVRRPSLSPNLGLGGLVWLAGALFLSLLAIPVRETNESSEPAEAPAAPAGDPVSRAGVELVRSQAPADLPGPGLEVWVERGLTILCHLSVVVGLALIGWRHFDDLHAGVAAATLYLLLPYAYLLMPHAALGVGRWYHAWPMALLVWAFFCYRRPALAGLFLGLASGSVFFPAWTAPAWLSFYWKRGAGRFALAFGLSAGLCLAVIGTLLALNGGLPPLVSHAWSLPSWQQWKDLPPDATSIWQTSDWSVHWAYRIPVFVAFVAFVVATLFWPAPKNLAHLLALSAAVLIGIQFWYTDRGGLYILWYLPLLLLLVFRPNLSAAVPPVPADDRLARLGRSLARAVWRRFRRAEPASPVA
jgi:hypothetical protein